MNTTRQAIPTRPVRREFVACVRTQKGGTQSVTVNACTEQEARATLLRMGYAAVITVY